MGEIQDAVSKGYFTAELSDIGPKADYGYSLDGGPVRADPRSGWQPEGPEGLSRIVDHDSFTWSDRSWRGIHLPSAVIYELHIGTFTPQGTFDGVIDKLDHLIQLGVSAIEVMPVAEFPGARGWGYDGVNLYAPHHNYGGPEGLRRLVDACHARGVGVILDVVYNHLGPSGNYLGEFGPYFTDRYHTPWGQAVNLDGPGSDEVRRFVIDNAIQWLRDYHCDGLRIDAVHALFDLSEIHILEELSREVGELSAITGWRRWLIAEFDRNDPRLIRSVDAGGFGIDAQWLDDFHHCVHALLTGETDGYYGDFGSLDDLATSLQRAYVYQGRYSVRRNRRHGRPADGLFGSSFIGYTQNHDHIGNRARGDRLASTLSAGRLAAAAALTLSAPFIPMLFQGEEWGASTPFAYFTDHTDPSLADAVRQGRQHEFEAFGWQPHQVPDPQDPATFKASCLDWTEIEDPRHHRLLEWYQALIRLRRSYPELGDGRLDRLRFDSHSENAFSVSRGAISVVVNLGLEETMIAVKDLDGKECHFDIEISSDPSAKAAGTFLTLPADSVSVLSIAPRFPQGHIRAATVGERHLTTTLGEP
jgi:maltooligosyltrehalose trehalohydrolase